MQQDLTAPAFLDADAEYRRKVREERYGAKHVPGAGGHSASAPSRSDTPAEALLEQLLAALNRARTDPVSVANALAKNRRPYFEGKELNLPNSNEVLMTAEGVEAVDDAINALKRASPSSALSYNSLLAHAAQVAAAAAGASNADSADGLAQAKKIGRSGKLGLSQLVQFGNANADEYLMRLIVDDGDSERQGRAAILNPDHHAAGFGSAAHPTYGRVLVLLFTDTFTSN